MLTEKKLDEKISSANKELAQAEKIFSLLMDPNDLVDVYRCQGALTVLQNLAIDVQGEKSRFRDWLEEEISKASNPKILGQAGDVDFLIGKVSAFKTVLERIKE